MAGGYWAETKRYGAIHIPVLSAAMCRMNGRSCCYVLSYPRHPHDVVSAQACKPHSEKQALFVM